MFIKKSLSQAALAVICLSATVLVSCSSIEKADIPTTANPQAEISKFELMLKEAQANNVDVLAPKDYQSAKKWQSEAKSDLASGQKQEEILDDVRKGRGYLNQAIKTAEPRQGLAVGVFEARQMALKAGASTHSALESDLADVDSALSDDADDLKNVSAKDLSDYQNRYVDLERRSVILTQLGNSQAILNGAEKDDAKDVAPSTFKKTQLALKTAESVVSTNVRSPFAFQKAVNDANLSAALLNDVMITIEQNKNLSEATALKLVSQNRQIKGLKTELNDTEVASAATERAMQNRTDELTSDLATSEEKLDTAKASVEMQQALEQARAQFPADEAEAYQQGGKLLIRMKKMNFASGRSDLPAKSLESLAKVSEVAKSLNASEIRVEGHTDSTGSADQNRTISEKRASAVATYLKSNGFGDITVQTVGMGFQKPIATNKSADGRSQNRRVDILITPAIQ